jgi:threonine synthase
VTDSDIAARSRVLGWRCAVCDAVVDIARPFPWRCPNSTMTDRRHVLRIESAAGLPAPAARAHDARVPTYVAHDADLAWAAYAEANGMDLEARTALVLQLDGEVRSVAGTGFAVTPFERSDALSAELGFERPGGVWVKDETGGVAGSQKARHLFTILLHLRAAEIIGHLRERPPLAIASCGNAALAAATLAKASNWPIDVYVPTWMSDGFGSELDRLGARVHRCERLASDPPGDPAMFRFREAVDAGAVPFTVQGPENALALDGGRTLGWEICEQLAAHGEPLLDRVFVQVGGGAFAACIGAGMSSMCPGARLHAVQTSGCAPLAQAWRRANERGLPHGDVGRHWADLMTVWPDPQSAADGIIDDETYDWIGVFDALGATDGSPVVAAETVVLSAHRAARAAGFDVSVTGSAGLAGLMSIRGEMAPMERVAVVMSGVHR